MDSGPLRRGAAGARGALPGRGPRARLRGVSPLRRRGRGGRDAALDRDVAVKVRTWNTASEAASLRAEARTLASLEHAGIVPVHDVGRLPDGRVYLVMRLVRGERLDRHAASLSIADRLRLFD